MSPAIGHKDCGIARRCKLFLGVELERGAIVLEDPFVWPAWNAAKNSQRASKLSLIVVRLQRR
jgi:hypothetical protein